MKYIFVDPSGSYNEGKGHTGIATMLDNDWSSLKVKSISAKDYMDRFTYWRAIKSEIIPECEDVSNIRVIIESFTIRANGFLIGKMPETILLIGVLSWELDKAGIIYTFQTPSQAKARFKDELLPRYIPGLRKELNGRYYLDNKCINDHIRDALKHLLYYKKYH